MDIRINSYIPMTNVEGPGTRFCIWVQGCSIHCKGCANSDMWDISKGTLYDVNTLFSLIKRYSDKIEGVTFLGGEPLDQFEAILFLAKKIQEIGLSVVLFTGYESGELSNKKDFDELCKYVDILIDGKYDYKKQDFSRPWVGSSNQEYHFYSNRYNETILSEYTNKIEIRIIKNKLTLTGMGDFSKLSKVV